MEKIARREDVFCLMEPIIHYCFMAERAVSFVISMYFYRSLGNDFLRDDENTPERDV